MKRIPCCGCSLLCDDILVETDGLFVDKILGACLKGKERMDQASAENRITEPMVRKQGDLKVVKWDEALEKVTQLFSNASKPLLYGFSNSTCEAQAKAIELARNVDGFIDSNSSICQGKVLDVIQEKGVNLSSLSEIINKSDVIVLWGSNPVESIPRLVNKILFSRGKFRMTGREIKTIIIVDPVKTASFGVMQVRDLGIRVEPNKDIELLKVLKQQCCEESGIPDEVAGVDKEDIQRFLLNLTEAENGVIIVGQGLLQPQKGENLVNELTELVNLINEKSQKGRLSLLMMGGHYNMAGFDHMALALTGKNNAIQFAKGRLQDGTPSLVNKISEGNFDLSFFMGTDPISHLPSKLSKKIASEPIIVADNRHSGTIEIADVVLPTALTGIECGGTAFRLDQVPVTIEKILDPPNNVPSDNDLLNDIISRLKGGNKEE